MHFMLVGGSGFLGSYLAKRIQEIGFTATIAHRGSELPWSWATSSLIHYTFNLNIDDSIKSLCDYIASIDDHVSVIMLAAVHHPDKVEESYNDAWHTNITQLAKFVNNLSSNANLTYISTDNVYGGGEEFYRFNENDDKKPINAYGQQKALAEKIVNAHGYNVIRCPFLIGPSLNSKPHFFDIIRKSIDNDIVFELFHDSYRSTLSFSQAAEFIVNIQIKYGKSYWESINIASDTIYSKYDIGLIIARQSECNTELIKPISFNDSDIFKTKRQKTILMNNAKQKMLLGIVDKNIELSF